MNCPSCGAPAPEGARFCASCGHQLLARADERRVATVVFADLVGFTTLSEARDPESVKNLVDGCFELLAADVRAFGGQVDKIVGDAIIALFGAPVAHEDDAERGVRAALQMQRTIAIWSESSSIGVRMRVGVNTGEVLVGSLRAGGDYTAMGDVVNIAQRLQSAAEPGQVIIGPATFAATSDVIRARGLGPLKAKGREETVDAWVVDEAVGLPGYRPPRSRAPLVGREAELGMLSNALENAVSRRRPHFVLIVGEAGLGSSRLADEVATLARKTVSATVLEGRCVPYGEANVWWPIAEVVRQACRIDPADAADSSRAKCLTEVAALLGLDEDGPEVRRIADGLLYLMGHEVPLQELEPARARDDALRALHVCIEGLSRKQPLVLVLSDIHWADDLVLELIDRLLERIRALPLLVVATARPDLDARWRPKPGRHNLLIANLDPLDRESCERLLGTLLESEPDPALRDALIERSGGNPFFLEELVSLVTCATDGGASLTDDHAGPQLPETLRGLVAARLDALSSRERSALDDAAVAGRSGRLDVLAALAGSRGEGDIGSVLDDLATRDLLVVDGRRWSFRSDVVREVAYGTLTKADRARRHATLADWLSARAKDTGREGEFLDLIAHHYTAAAELATELGGVTGVDDDLRLRALHTLEKAAMRAEQSEIPQAAHLFGHALELVPEDDSPRRWRLLLGRSRARLGGRRELSGAHADALTVAQEAEAAGDNRMRARALNLLGDIQTKEGVPDEAAETLREAVALWRALDDRLGLAEALRAFGMNELYRGNLEAAEDKLTHALEAFQDLEDKRGAAWALQNIAWIQFRRGDFAGADIRLQESATAFGELDDSGGAGWALGLLAWVRFAQGRFGEAEKIAQRVLSASDDIGNAWGAAMMQALLANIRLWEGKTLEAVEFAREGVARFRALEDRWGEVQALTPLARGLVALGSVEEGLRVVDEALELSATVADPSVEWIARNIAVATAMQVGRPERALDLVGLGPGGIPKPGLIGTDRTASIAGAFLQLGRVADALGPLEEAREEEGDDRAAHVDAMLAPVLSAAGRPADAIASADNVLGDARATYHDRFLAGMGRGLAYARLGDASESTASFATVTRILGATGDRLSMAVNELASGHALAHLGSRGASDTIDEARAALSSMDVDVAAWERAITLALGSQPLSS